MEQLETAYNRTLTTRKVWKVAIYLRLSQEDGKEESQSISNQRKIILDYLDNRFSGEYEIIDTYIDDGISGITAIHRPEFLRMTTDITKGRIDTVICKSLSRAFRNSGDQAEYLRVFFPQHKTRFITTDTPHIDTYLNPKQAFAMDVSFYGAFNESYPLMISEEINKTFKSMREDGKFTGGFAPYGYTKGDTEETRHKLFIDEEAAETVRKIFNWFVYDGMRMRTITEKLNSLGVPNPTTYKRIKGTKYKGRFPMNDGLWNITTVGAILSHEVYIGNMVQGRYRTISPVLKKSEQVPKEEWVIVKNTHEPIISDELFEKAQSLRVVRHRTPKNRKSIDLFSGFLKCADCKMTMVFRQNTYITKKGERASPCYLCSTYVMRSKIACSNHYINQKSLKQVVLKAIQNQIETVCNLEQLLDQAQRGKIAKTEQNRLDKTLKTKLNELSKMEKIADNLYIDWKTEVLTKSEYIRMKSSFEEKISHLEQVIETIKFELEERKNKTDEITPYLEAFREHKNVTELNRAILLDLVEKIYVHEDKSITIEFKFANTYNKIVESV
ncbi:hypothetical protein ATZ33_08010 [Enterococcus silesiacus]|uniref:Recombinase n=1 Tax=Enterococcus silesiacus TaxID=332949 RepID=A0A0S3KAG0_9ENTE|nr:recombinase family protein [Enterococcus silesiacus]ALS01313.1 hypothetical protein ATZ33_08010 [Enterococcus silesiacus]OJG90708.1 hypothetical protein RV15_GL001059 [Enterococcus silesiacus]